MVSISPKRLHEAPHLQYGAHPDIPTSAQLPDKMPIIQSKLAKRRLGHALLRAEVFNLLDKFCHGH